MKTLAWADEAAADRDYDDALFFLSVVQESGTELSGDYVEKHKTWTVAARTAEARPAAP